MLAFECKCVYKNQSIYHLIKTDLYYILYSNDCEAFGCSLVYLLLCRSSRDIQVEKVERWLSLVQIKEGVREQENVKCHPHRDFFFLCLNS